MVLHTHHQPPRRHRKRPHRFTVVSYNINGLFGSKLELARYLSLARPHVVCLQETFHTESAHLRFPGYHVDHLLSASTPGTSQRSSRGRRSGGLVTLIRDDLTYHHLYTITYHDSHDLFCILATVVLDNTQHPPLPLSIINCYFRPSVRIPEDSLPHIPTQHSIILGDFNGHHPAWGTQIPHATDQRGTMLYHWVHSHNYKLLHHIQEPPTYMGYNGTMSSIDVMGVTKDIAPAAHKCILTNALAGSDHLPLQLSLGVIPHFTKPPCRSAKRSTWNFKTVDWTAFRSTLDSHIASIDWSSSVHVIHSQLSRAFAAAASHSISRGRLHLYKPYWTSSLNKLRLEKNAIRRALYRRTAALLPHNILQEKFCSISRRYKAAIRTAQRQHWEKFTSTLDFATTKDWKVVRAMALGVGQTTTPTTVIDNARGAAAANLYSLYLSRDIYRSRLSTASIHHWQRQGNLLLRQRRSGTYVQSYPQTPFTWSELAAVLYKAKKTSAPGPDNIHPKFIVHASDLALKAILRLVNLTYTTSEIPRQWRSAKIIVLKKNPRSHESTCKNFRPISLTSIVARLAESMVLNRVQHELLTTANPQPLHPHQFGFQRSRGVEEEVAYVSSSIKSSLHSQHKIVGLLSLDLRKAYDTTNLSVLRSRLFHTNVTTRLILWISAFLNGREFYVDINEERSEWRKQSQGLPQGAVLAPVLWAIFVNPLLQLLDRLCTAPNPALTGFAAYADDVVLWASGSSQFEVDCKLQLVLNRVQSWVESVGMELAEDKTRLIYFTKTKRRTIRPNQILLKGFHLQPVDQITILGVIFDSTLSWGPQIEKIRKNVKHRAKTISLLLQTPTKIHKKLYRQYIQYNFTMGSSAWAFGVTQERWKLVEGCYSCAIKSMLGCPIYASKRLSLRLADEPPLTLVIYAYLSRLFHKLARLHYSPFTVLTAATLSTSTGTAATWYSEVHSIPVLRLLRSSAQLAATVWSSLYHASSRPCPEPACPVHPSNWTTPLTISTSLPNVPVAATRTDYSAAITEVITEHLVSGRLVLLVDASYQDIASKAWGNRASYAWTLIWKTPVSTTAFSDSTIKGQGALGPQIWSSTEAELQALRYALLDLTRIPDFLTLLRHRGSLIICTDSLSTCNLLQQGWCQTSPYKSIVWFILSSVVSLQADLPSSHDPSTGPTRLQWIKAHVGFLLHDEVDMRAKTQSTMPPRYPRESLGGALAKIQHYKCRALTTLQYTIPGEIYCATGPYAWHRDPIHSLPRVDQCLIYRLRQGVLPLYHPALCPLCNNSAYSVRHLLLYCPGLNRFRPSFISTPVQPNLEDKYFFMLLYSTKELLQVSLTLAKASHLHL